VFTRAASRGYYRNGAVSRLLQADSLHGSYAKEMFSLLALELWHREFIDRSTGSSV